MAQIKSVKIEHGLMTIQIPIEDPPALSASGKSKVIASTRGNQVTDREIDGKLITIGLNAYIKA